MKIRRFEDLEVWQLARKLVKQIYEISKNAKLSKDFGLRNQLQRSAVSIMSNIAEGFERKSKKEFIQFLNIAKALSGELRSQLYINLGFGISGERYIQYFLQFMREDFKVYCRIHQLS